MLSLNYALQILIQIKKKNNSNFKVNYLKRQISIEHIILLYSYTHTKLLLLINLFFILKKIITVTINVIKFLPFDVNLFRNNIIRCTSSLVYTIILLDFTMFL